MKTNSMKNRYVTLPNGRICGLGMYVAAWRRLLTMDRAADISGWSHFPESVGQVLGEIQAGIHDRINRHIPGYGRGRKWSYEWQTETRRAARELNTPRLCIHWLPLWLHSRFAHRITPNSY